MAQSRRSNPYAKAYSFGTDGNAALAGGPISSYRPMAGTQGRQKGRRGLVMSRWICVVCVAVLLVFMISSFAELAGRKSAIRKDIAVQEMEMQRAATRIGELDAELVVVDDEVRMRAVALNRLGMQVPTQAQVERIPEPYVMTPEAPLVIEEQGSVGLLDLVQTIFSK